MRLLAIPVALVVSAGVATLAQEPSMIETKAWLETEAPSMMSAQVGFTGGAVAKVTVSGITLNDCVLSWTERYTGAMEDQNTVALPLRAVDTGGVLARLKDDTLPRSDYVEVPVRKATGQTVTRSRPGKSAETSESVMMLATDAIAAGRVANAVRRAATLCGATSPF